MFGKRLRLFKAFGFEIRIDASWLFLAILITWSLAEGMFPYRYPTLSRGTYWWMGFAGAVGLFASILVHELSHSLVARHHGLPMKGITLFIFGGVAEMEGEPARPGVEFQMAIVGPIASVVLGFVFLGFTALAESRAWLASVIGVLAYLSTINFFLAAFNMVPAFPLDGGRVLRAALWHWKKDLGRATKTVSAIGSGFGLLLFGLGLMALFNGNFLGGVWWCLIGLFLRDAAQVSYQQFRATTALRGETVRRFMKGASTVGPDTSAEEALKIMTRSGGTSLLVVENGEFVGIVTMKDLADFLTTELDHDEEIREAA